MVRVDRLVPRSMEGQDRDVTIKALLVLGLRKGGVDPLAVLDLGLGPDHFLHESSGVIHGPPATENPSQACIPIFRPAGPPLSWHA